MKSDVEIQLHISLKVIIPYKHLQNVYEYETKRTPLRNE